MQLVHTIKKSEIWLQTWYSYFHACFRLKLPQFLLFAALLQISHYKIGLLSNVIKLLYKKYYLLIKNLM